MNHNKWHDKAGYALHTNWREWFVWQAGGSYNSLADEQRVAHGALTRRTQCGRSFALLPAKESERKTRGVPSERFQWYRFINKIQPLLLYGPGFWDARIDSMNPRQRVRWRSCCLCSIFITHTQPLRCNRTAQSDHDEFEKQNQFLPHLPPRFPHSKKPAIFGVGENTTVSHSRFYCIFFFFSVFITSIFVLKQWWSYNLVFCFSSFSLPLALCSPFE